MAAWHTKNIQLLQANVGEHGESSEFRILVNNTSVKYIVIDGGLYTPEDMRSAPSLVPLLPPLSCGVWNKGRISRNPASGKAYVAEASEVILPGVNRTWHPARIDHLELHRGQRLSSNAYEATCSPRFGSSKVVVKLARFGREVPRLERETVAYERIAGCGIGPAFLAHLTEEGRVIGFVVERVADFHHATSEDLPLCRLALSNLHRLGIKHGDTGRHNFLIHDGKATLIDFENASQTAGANELQAELDGLEDQLRDITGGGGCIVGTNSS